MPPRCIAAVPIIPAIHRAAKNQGVGVAGVGVPPFF
jgi:hypothetical protein